jgi:hypothetical protein
VLNLVVLNLVANPLGLGQERLDRGTAPPAAGPGTTRPADLVHGVGATLDLAPHAAFRDPVAQAHHRHPP